MLTEVADKDPHQQNSGAGSNSDLCSSKAHQKKSMEFVKARKDYLWETRRDMYKCDKRKARPEGRALYETTKLLFLIFFLYRLDTAIVRGLRFRVFHSLLGFGGFLGASFGTLFLLLVEDLLAA
jgi:hypothetical protein